MTRAVEQRFLDCLQLVSRQAGSVARHLQGKVKAQKKSGHGSPEGEALTAVDLAVQEVILHALAAALPEAAVDAEEDTAMLGRFPAEDGRRPVVIIDPIDGTLNYIRKSNDYAVMAALSIDGTYRSAVVYFPVNDSLFWSVAGGGAWRQTGPEQPQRVSIKNLPQIVLVTPPVSTARRESLAAAGWEVQQSRCSAVDSSAPVTGRAVGSVSAQTAGRRRAIGFLLTVEAGGVVAYADGRRWEGEDPGAQAPDRGPMVVAATPSVADRIAAALQAG